MKQVLMTMFDLSLQAGGITRVMMNRGRMFREVGIRASIVTFAFNPELLRTVMQLKEQGRLARSVPVFNLFAYYSAISDRRCESSSAAGVVHEMDAAGDVLAEQGLCVERSGFAPDAASRRVITDPQTGLKTAEEYYSESGQCYLIQHFGGPHGELCSVTLVEAATNERRTFQTMNELYSHFLRELALTCLPCALIADAPWSAVPVLGVQSTGIFRILTIHNNHYDAPFRYGAPLRGKYAGVLHTFAQADALIVLTHAQQQDIERQFGRSAKIHCIPNSLTAFDPPTRPMTRDPFLVVTIARYHKTKGLMRIIRAFKDVLRKVPQARLQLHGSGEQESELKALIASLGLARAVTLHGYATNVADVLRRASIVVAASRFEGFGLGIAEALSEGTPVVSLDCNYGPAEIITDGVDGHLAYTDHDLSDLMIALLRDPSRARAMGEAGRRNVQRFSKEAIRERWLSLFAQLQQEARASD